MDKTATRRPRQGQCYPLLCAQFIGKSERSPLENSHYETETRLIGNNGDSLQPNNLVRYRWYKRAANRNGAIATLAESPLRKLTVESCW